MMLLVVVFLLGYFMGRMFSTEGFGASDWQEMSGGEGIRGWVIKDYDNLYL